MSTLDLRKGAAFVLAVALGASMCSISPALAAKTKVFEEKEGFHKEPKDIINTLKDNQVAQFNTFLEGLPIGFDLDKVLKGAGPYTVFAPTDNAFKKIPGDDVQSLFANKKKTKQVLQYCIIDKAKLDSKALRAMKSVKTMEGHDLAITDRDGDLYVGQALVIVSDIPCSNGVIHAIDHVVMPPLSQ